MIALAGGTGRLGSLVVRRLVECELDVQVGDPVFIMYVALDRAVEYASGPKARGATHVHLSPASLGAMATATDQCRAGLLPEEPAIVSWNDSTIDPTRAPEGST
jgi:phytoene dehydrogenase-like protein